METISQRPFHQWMHSERQSQGLSLQFLSKESGVDVGSLSRIENNQTQPTLNTVIRLCRGWGISPETLLQGLRYNSPSPVYKTPSPGADLHEHRVLTFDDVCAFLHVFSENPVLGRTVVARVLSRAAAKLTAEKHEDIPPVSPEEIEKLLLVNPRLYSFQLLSPPGLTPETIEMIQQSGGVIIASDITVYLESLSVEHRERVKKVQQRWFSLLLQRLQDFGSIGRTKLVDILTLCDLLGEQDDIFFLFWKAAEFEEEITSFLHGLSFTRQSQVAAGGDRWLKSMFKLVSIVVIGSRWMHSLFGSDTAWLLEVRETFGAEYPVERPAPVHVARIFRPAYFTDAEEIAQFCTRVLHRAGGGFLLGSVLPPVETLTAWLRQLYAEVGHVLVQQEQIRGFLLMLPLTHEQILRILSGEQAHAEVKAEELVPLEPGRPLDFLIVAAVVEEGRADMGASLFRQVLRLLHSLAKRGVEIEGIYARAISRESRDLCVRLGMRPLEDLPGLSLPGRCAYGMRLRETRTRYTINIEKAIRSYRLRQG